MKKIIITFGMVICLFCNTFAENTNNSSLGLDKISPSIGLRCFYPNPELASSIGAHIDLETDSWVYGISYFSGNNNIKTLSKGTYSMLPMYICRKISVNPQTNFNFGVGYSFNSHKMDASVVSILEEYGYSDPKETLSSSLFVILGFDFRPSKDKVKYSVKYYYQPSNVQVNAEYAGKSYSDSMGIDLSGLLFDMSFIF
jgi:hypothetical protein